MAEVGGALLSSFLPVLIDRISSREFFDFFRGQKLTDGLLWKLGTALRSINTVLEDAEEKLVTKAGVKEWSDELKDAVYDAEDILDEIATEALRCKLDAEFQTTGSKVRNSISSSRNSFVKEIEPKIKEVLDRIEYLAKQKDLMGLREGVGGKPSERLPTTSLVEESGIYGRDGDKEQIMNFLLSDDNEMHMIAVVGMGGLGKTTLVQLVYNDNKVKEHFDLKAWVCVSEEFDLFKITQTILEAVTSSTCDIKDLNRLQVTLKEKLMGKKILLVLDDVWNKSYGDWEILSNPFKSRAQGSRIIVTTRDAEVASVMCATATHRLNKLSEVNCWSLFEKYAFDVGDANAHPRLEILGRKIVEKCGGLPLAVKTLGALLRSKPDVEEWDEVLKSELWDLPIGEANILPALRLSYKYLPSHLKRCFAYCSIFPKDYAFKKDEVVLLWMAEGFLEQPINKTMEKVGYEYFLALVSRSLFQNSSQGKLRFVMHDLINDLAKFVCGQFSFRLEIDNFTGSLNKTRHLSYGRTTYDSFKKFKAVHEAKQLRTFLPLKLSWADRSYLTKKVSHDLLPQLTCLRVLSLSNYTNMTELPDSIGKIKQLRYLDLSRTKIKRLPDSICKLYNLQTLKLSDCKDLTVLPRNMWKLINLRYLDIDGTDVLKEMPIQMDRLKCLQILTKFIVSKHNGSRIGELGKLTNLQSRLSILELQNVASPMDALDARLKDKKDLKQLVLEWNADTNISENQRTVLDNLQPHTNLKTLYIKYYGGENFPDWIGHHSFSNMTFLQLYSCNCSLPPLGQLLSLQVLSIVRFHGIVTVGPEFYGSGSSSIKPFEALKVLEFKDMLNWEKWLPFDAENEGEAFPRLETLYVVDCPKLTGGLPIHLPSLTELSIQRCPQLVASLPSAPAIRELELRHCNEVLLKELPTGLQNLKIEGFDALELRIGDYSSLTSLEELYLNGCHSLRSFPFDLFPKLNSISINECRNLKSLSVSEQDEHDLLTSWIDIRRCPNFVSFPKGGLRAPNLTTFHLYDCESLKSLPDKMHIFLPSLETLSINFCPEVESFPEGGLPSNLKSVAIQGCEKLLENRMEWGLQKHLFIRDFSILSSAKDVEYFPVAALLPTTLTYLWISNFRDLKYLGEGLLQLTSLEKLNIGCCRKLTCMPEDGLPASLSVLEISGCPLLSKQLQRKKGKEWLKIADVPSKLIDGELID